MIEKIKLHNFKRFEDFSVDFNDSINILIGDNESGKSSILTAIDLVLSGSRSKVETFGLESLFNADIIEGYLSSTKKYEDLPELYIELYLSDLGNKLLDGQYNSENKPSHGILLKFAPRDDLSYEIKEILKQDEDNFPYEYYSISFKTFSGESYTGYAKFLKHLLLDNSQINNEYATKSYIKSLYQKFAEESEKNKHKNAYRLHKEKFRDDILTDLNNRIEEYAFSIRNNSKANLETDLTIKEGKVDIENRGKGRHCFVRTDFALQKSGSEFDVILMEEPENHLSHIWMKKLILKISNSECKQILIATHNDLISARLDLRKCILLNSNSSKAASIRALPEDTAKFFMKAPDNNILEFILSSKIILVEGDSEFILLESFYQKITSKKPEESGVHIISVDGTSFKRYLELALILNIKTAVICDNDKDYNKNCVDRYKEYKNPNIQIFAEKDNLQNTFEKTIYTFNKVICDTLFGEGRRTLSVEEYMLSNKADCAFELLETNGDNLLPPDYIKDAIEWISV